MTTVYSTVLEGINSSFLSALNDVFMDKNASDEEEITEIMPYNHRPEYYGVPIIFAMIFMVGVIGNGLLIYVVLSHKSLRNNAPNLYILNLSLGDFAFILISVPFTSTIYTFESWPYGELICKSTQFFRTLSVAISVYTLTALSADRYHAIIDPLGRYLGGKRSVLRKTILVCTGIWILGLTLATIDGIFSNLRIITLGIPDNKGDDNTEHDINISDLADNFWGNYTKTSSLLNDHYINKFPKLREYSQYNALISNLNSNVINIIDKSDYDMKYLDDKTLITQKRKHRGAEQPEAEIQMEQIVKVCHPHPLKYGILYPQLHTLTKFLILLVFPLLIISVYYCLMAKRLIQSTGDILQNENKLLSLPSGPSKRADYHRYSDLNLGKHLHLPYESPLQTNDTNDVKFYEPSRHDKVRSISQTPIFQQQSSLSTNESGSFSAQGNFQINDSLNLPLAFTSQNDILERFEGSSQSPSPIHSLTDNFGEKSELPFNDNTLDNTLLNNHSNATKMLYDESPKVKTLLPLVSQNNMQQNPGNIKIKELKYPDLQINSDKLNPRGAKISRNSRITRSFHNLATNIITSQSKIKTFQFKRHNTLLMPPPDKNLKRFISIGAGEDASSKNDPFINNLRLKKQMESRKKIAKMVLIFIGIFLICWLPYHIVTMWFFCYPHAQSHYNMFWHYFKIVGFVCSYSNSCINPIALYFISKTFRKYFNYYLTLQCLLPSWLDRSKINDKGKDLSIKHAIQSNNTTTKFSSNNTATKLKITIDRASVKGKHGNHNRKNKIFFSKRKKRHESSEGSFAVSSLERTSTFYEPSRIR